MIVGEEFVERAGSQEHLLAVGPPQPRGLAEIDRTRRFRRRIGLEVGK
jgi:hypothetical protein